MQPDDRALYTKLVIDEIAKQGLKNISNDDIKIHYCSSPGGVQGSHNIIGSIKSKGIPRTFDAVLSGSGEQMKVDKITLPDFK